MSDVLIIGAGPAGLFAAENLASAGLSVLIVDQMASPARKFLMAGRGGLNLTHSESLTGFVDRYREASPFLAPMIDRFTPDDLRQWCEGLGQETFIGSSGRVFPKTMKASPLLRAWLRRLASMNVELRTRMTFLGLKDRQTAILRQEDGSTTEISARAILLAMGGASWQKLGSDARWISPLKEQGIEITAFQPSNCGFLVDWSDVLKEKCAGHPLKQIRLSLGERAVLGEAILSEKGIEGGAIYALSADLREAINSHGSAIIGIDLRPNLSLEDLTSRLSRPRGKQSMATFLKKVLKLNVAEQALLREVGPLPTAPLDLAQRIKSLEIRSHAPYPMDRAISSSGGIALEALDDTLMLKALPGVFAAGEMLDWEAPTGGYLLQACFATGFCAAKGITNYLHGPTNGDNCR